MQLMLNQTLGYYAGNGATNASKFHWSCYKMQQVLWSNFIILVLVGAKLLHTQISLVRAGYEASGSSTSNFIGLQAGYQAKMHLTQISGLYAG
jgi:hypothetical protein